MGLLWLGLMHWTLTPPPPMTRDENQLFRKSPLFQVSGSILRRVVVDDLLLSYNPNL